MCVHGGIKDIRNFELSKNVLTIDYRHYVLQCVPGALMTHENSNRRRGVAARARALTGCSCMNGYYSRRGL